MSNHSPYNNNDLANKMEDMPMPDINMAWADMEKRLAKKDDKKPIPFWFNGCALMALLAVILFGIGYWFYNAKNKNEQKDNIASINKKDNGENVKVKNTNTNFENDSDTIKTNEQNNSSVAKINTEKINDNIVTEKTISNTEEIFDKANNKYKTNSKSKVNITSADAETDISLNTKSKKATYTKKIEDATTNKITKTKKIKSKYKTKTTEPDQAFDFSEKDAVEIANHKSSGEDKTKEIPEIKKENNTEEEIVTKITKEEKVITTTKDSSTKKEPIAKKIKSKLFFNAGIGMQQQLAINGQTNTPYNSLGRSGTLLDYIPSVYARLEKEKKWFIQIEGKYGAPQYNKEFVYAQTNQKDSALSIFTNIKSTTLKKSFYHQIPITFNYYVTPKWSIGAGIQLNKFTGALVEKEEVLRNDITQTENSLSKFQVLEKVDSNNVFSKSYTLALFETQYKWKRFTFGAKYSFGLSPYIKFILPNATEQKLMSKTALVFVKYEFWRSKKRSGKNLTK